MPWRSFLYARFEKVSKGLGEIDVKFDKEFLEKQDALEGAKEVQRCAEFAAQMVRDRRMKYHQLSEEFEDDLNEGLGCRCELVGDTVAATSALSCGGNDRDGKELRYMFGKGSHDDYEFVTAEVSTSPLRWSEVGERVGEAVKSKGQEEATVEEEMSVTNAQAGNTKDQVKLKRVSGLVESRFFFPINVEFTRDGRDSGQRAMSCW